MSRTAATELYNQLARECEMAMSLVDVLLEEQSCLIQFQTTQLQALALKKEAMMLDLDQHCQTNITSAKAHGYSADLLGLEKWAQQLNTYEPHLIETLTTLKATLQQAKRINETNGTLVAEQMAGLQERINILTAAALGTQNSDTTGSATYGPKGALTSTNNNGQKARAVIR